MRNDDLRKSQRFQGAGLLFGLMVVGALVLGLNSQAMATGTGGGGSTDGSAGQMVAAAVKGPPTNPQEGVVFHGGPDIPPKPGVAASDGVNTLFNCKPHPFSQPPNVVCHPGYEDRMGCNGDVALMCDTVPQGQGTTCRCVTPAAPPPPDTYRNGIFLCSIMWRDHENAIPQLAIHEYVGNSCWMSPSRECC